MTPARWLIVIFWIVVVGLIIKGIYGQSQVQQTTSVATAPAEKHFFFTPPPGASAKPASPDADLRQVFFTADENVPFPGRFTCTATLKNVGKSKATDVQLFVRPFRGGTYGTGDSGHQNFGPVKDTEAVAQFGSWVTFPDLAPGESSTEKISFADQPPIEPGKNPQPQILFKTDKSGQKTNP